VQTYVTRRVLTPELRILSPDFRAQSIMQFEEDFNDWDIPSYLNLSWLRDELAVARASGARPTSKWASDLVDKLLVGGPETNVRESYFSLSIEAATYAQTDEKRP
jgi:hypothetical protein